MDAFERIRLADGTEVSGLRIVDDYTGAFLLTRVVSLGTVDGHACLRDPRDPAAGVGPLGPAEPQLRGQRLSLGLAGGLADGAGTVAVGSGHRPGPQPTTPAQDNGVIECAQNTGKRWADPPRCFSVAELQRNLDAMDRHQREGFPDAAHSRSRLFPGLAHSGRAY